MASFPTLCNDNGIAHLYKQKTVGSCLMASYIVDG